ncbi:MAG: type II toxin-antitoxin system HicA family toxin [Chitinophagales bacterium]|nr:type II toxin-antitoxin system HicA family toxin [Chitinophagales bacterium]
MLKPLGYSPTRQTGSHIRITTTVNGEHHVTIPNHSPIKIGTLSAIIYEIAIHHHTPKETLMKQLFG